MKWYESRRKVTMVTVTHAQCNCRTLGTQLVAVQTRHSLIAGFMEQSRNERMQCQGCEHNVNMHYRCHGFHGYDIIIQKQYTGKISRHWM